MTKYEFDKVDFRNVTRGDSFERVLDIDPVFDTTGFSAFAQIRRKPGETGAPLLAFTTNLNGQALTLSLTPAQTENVPAGTYYFDVEFRNGQGEKHSMPVGVFELVNDVTR